MKIARIVTASFDANLAKEVGVPAAILYNALLWVSQTEMAKRYDVTGWFYYTAKDYEEETTFTKNTFTAAVNKLIEAGYIEKKQKYIKHTSVSVNHFRFLKYANPGSQQMGIGGVTANGNPYIIEENIEEKSRSPENRNPDPGLTASKEDNFSFVSGSEQSERLPNGFPDESAPATADDPFDQPVQRTSIVSLKDEKSKKDKEDSRAWAIVGKIVKKCQEKGMKVNPNNVKLKSAVKFQLTKASRSEEDIMFVLNKYLTTEDKFYSPASKSIEAVFSQDYFEVYLNMDYKPKQKPMSYTF